MSIKSFPVEISVLSSEALSEYIAKQYFNTKTNVRCRLHYRSIHDTYRIVADGKEYYLKVYRQGLRSREEIINEIKLINCLRDNGIETAFPIEDKYGEYVACFRINESERYAVLFSTIGNNFFDNVNETPQLNERLGENVALIHKIWDDKNIQVVRTPLDTQLFIHKSMDYIRVFHELYNFDIQFLEDVAKRTSNSICLLSKTASLYGLCHGDIYSDNIRLNSSGIPILFDFDFAGIGWRAYDVSLYAYSFGLGAEKSKLEKRKYRLDAFLQGYQKNITISDEFIKSIPLFIPFRRIFNIGFLYIAMANIWGDNAALRSTKSDIETLKQWLELNPVI